MSEFTRSKIHLFLDEDIKKLREENRRNGIPTILDESLNMLLLVLKIKDPEKILEIGTAAGLSGICMLQAAKNAVLTTVEADESNYIAARKNFERYNLLSRVNTYFDDAGNAVRFLDGSFDFIFLDGAKARYYDYLPELKRLLGKGGVLFADNVLFRGLIESGRPPHRDMTIVRNMRAFIEELSSDSGYVVSVLDIGDGVLIAHKNI